MRFFLILLYREDPIFGIFTHNNIFLIRASSEKEARIKFNNIWTGDLTRWTIVVRTLNLSKKDLVQINPLVHSSERVKNV